MEKQKDEFIVEPSVLIDEDDNMPWMYLIDSYLPIMYGLLDIEKICQKENISEEIMKTFKSKFMNFAKSYYQSNELYYMDDDLETLEKINMTIEFKELLESSAWDYYGSTELDAMIYAAKAICSEEEIDEDKVRRRK